MALVARHHLSNSRQLLRAPKSCGSVVRGARKSTRQALTCARSCLRLGCVLVLGLGRGEWLGLAPAVLLAVGLGVGLGLSDAPRDGRVWVGRGEVVGVGTEVRGDLDGRATGTLGASSPRAHLLAARSGLPRSVTLETSITLKPAETKLRAIVKCPLDSGAPKTPTCTRWSRLGSTSQTAR